MGNRKNSPFVGGNFDHLQWGKAVTFNGKKLTTFIGKSYLECVQLKKLTAWDKKK
jgi:hypothetical protein